MTELPGISKRELRRVGVEVREERASGWMTRGWRELELYLWRCDQVEKAYQLMMTSHGSTTVRKSRSASSASPITGSS